MAHRNDPLSVLCDSTQWSANTWTHTNTHGTT